MPDKTGYDVFAAARRKSPTVPVILMTGFGYDPNHCIVRASQEGLAGGAVQAVQGRSVAGGSEEGVGVGRGCCAVKAGDWNLVPSPLYAGERVRVRGGVAGGTLADSPLTPTLSPEYGEREPEASI